jgi:hypothetical protein
MTTPDSRPRRHVLRSAGALLLGFVSIVMLSLGTDQLFHELGVYPPWSERMDEPGDNLLALSYRCAYGVLGSYIAARFAPYAPMGHALALGVIGLPLGAAGMVAALRLDLGPAWYPIALFLSVLPCAWLGGVLYRWRHDVSSERSG